MVENLRFALFGLVILGVPLYPQASLAADDGAERLIDFFAEEGCAIGPTTRLKAERAGFRAEAIDALVEDARLDAGAVETGPWLVLAPSRCTIEVPRVTSLVKPGDPEVQDHLYADEEVDSGARCFIDPDATQEALKVSRSWNREMAHEEYFRFLAAGFRAGEITFYSPDPLRTPMGMQLTTGACAEQANIDDIRRDHERLMRDFGAMIRKDGETAICETGGSPSWRAFTQSSDDETDEPVNAWIFMEAYIITLAAGWHEGASLYYKGIPRPPLCHYE